MLIVGLRLSLKFAILVVPISFWSQGGFIDHDASLKTRIFLHFFLNYVNNNGLDRFGSSSQEIYCCFL